MDSLIAQLSLSQQTLRLQGTKETRALIFCCTLRALYSLALSLKKLYIVEEMKQHPFAREKGRKCRHHCCVLVNLARSGEALCISNCTHARAEPGEVNATDVIYPLE
jgi:hypothetical protein